jgi:hypothetical protein
MPTESSKTPSPIPPRIKPQQWALPVSFDEQGNPISLRQYSDNDPKAIPFAELTDAQRVALVAKRIELQPDFEIAVLGVGVYGSKSAAHEVQAGTRLGRKLVAIQGRVIQHLLAETQKGPR